MKRTDPSRALAVTAGLVIVALTGAAFWLSYEHLHDVAAAHGLGHARERAWAWPATVDLFIVAGELLMLRAALRGRIDWWAIGLTASGSLGSIALNVAGVGAEAQPLDYVVAAVPPTAALLAFGALMRQVHDALRSASESAPTEGARSTLEQQEQPTPGPVPVAPTETTRPAIESAPAAPESAPTETTRPAIESAPVAPTVDPDPVSVGSPESAPTVGPRPRRATGAVPTAAKSTPRPRRTLEELLSEARALSTGEQESAERIRTALRVGAGRARELRDLLAEERDTAPAVPLYAVPGTDESPVPAAAGGAR